MADRQCVVFDLDGTLLTSDSFARLMIATLTRSPARLTLALVLTPACLLLAGHRYTRLQAERLIAWTAFAGRSRLGRRAYLQDFAIEHAGQDGGRRIGIALQRLQQHRRAGDRIIVATACAEPLAEEICRALDLHGVDLIASTFTPHRWRLPHAVPARAEQKLTAIRQAGIRLPVDHAYADSPTDLPLLQAARTAHLVRPRDRHLPVLLRALGRDVEVLR